MPPTTLPTSAYEGLGLPSDTIRILTRPQPVPASAASPNVLQAEPLSARDLMPNQSSITLYAELLLNIRTVTLFASLRTVHTRETKAQLSTDGHTVTVSHEGESASLRLPIKAMGGGDAALSLPAHPPSKELSLRLQIEEQDGSELFAGVQAEERKANVVPWDGASLNQMKNSTVLCKNCRSICTSSEKITEWRDLPNENWAEMMDFWHCHKPDEHHLHDHTHEAAIGGKGYAASNRLQATEGVGFVDLTSLLLKGQDCEGVEAQGNSVICKKCKHTLGVLDESVDGYRVWKWAIHITSSTSSSINTYSTQKWISARLLHLIENQGVRKFHVHPETLSTSHANTSPSESTRTPVPSLLLWVFTPDLLFSSSIPSDDRLDPTRAMKVFFQSQTWSPPKAGEAESVTIEDVAFPEELYGELEGVFRESQKLLPVNARKFQGWEVGLLKRFDIGEIGSGSRDDGSPVH